MFARSVWGKRFFPLDRKLRLRDDHWSDGAARVATRLGLQGKSFSLAAEAYEDAVGSGISSDSLRRITEGWGEKVEEKRELEAKQIYEAEVPQLLEQIVSVHDPIENQVSISSDGGMVLIREEGWKEVKMCVFSHVNVRQGIPTPQEPQPDPEIRLAKHSYQAGLWDADKLGQHQFLEGGRRRVALCRQSSTNDGAVWIDRITATNFPQALQIIDWQHSDERLWKVAKAAFGEGTPQANQWAEEHIDLLWHGRTSEIVATLYALNWSQITCPEEVAQSPGYFDLRQSKMQYDLFRQQGFPIGSGSAESGINTVVHHRMKRQGRGWKRQNAQAMLAGLSELHSHRFYQVWFALLQSPN